MACQKEIIQTSRGLGHIIALFLLAKTHQCRCLLEILMIYVQMKVLEMLNGKVDCAL